MDSRKNKVRCFTDTHSADAALVARASLAGISASEYIRRSLRLAFALEDLMGGTIVEQEEEYGPNDFATEVEFVRPTQIAFEIGVDAALVGQVVSGIFGAKHHNRYGFSMREIKRKIVEKANGHRNDH